MKKLTFKEYLESKEKLLQAITENPKQSLEYTVTKYCTLIVGEKENKQYVGLKPKQTIVVEWLYKDVYSIPEPISIAFKDVKTIQENTQFAAVWVGDRLQKWLQKNAEEKDSLV